LFCRPQSAVACECLNNTTYFNDFFHRQLKDKGPRTGQEGPEGE
jgi:hypothetical protein